MFPIFAAALLLSGILSSFAFAETPQPHQSSVLAAPSDRQIARAAPIGQPPKPALHGPCQLGVVAMVGNKFEMIKTGRLGYLHDTGYAPVNWDLDALIFARGRRNLLQYG